MRKIGIDARLLNQSGVGTYLQNLLFYLDKNNSSEVLYYVYLLKNDFEKLHFRSKNIIKKEANFHWHGFSEQFSFPLTLLKDNLDLMHFTYFTFPIFYCKKFLITIHDMTPILFKTGRASTKNLLIYYLKHFIFKIVFFLGLKNSVKVIVPTKTVKDQIVSYYGEKFKDKIEVIYEGVSYNLLKSSKKKINQKEFSYKNFFLYVGNFYPHKNVENLIEAFSYINKKYSLILVGTDDFFAKRIEDLINKKNVKNIFLVKNIKKDKLKWFYQNSLALIHPSLSEGFGLTLIESAYYNRPIIASDIKVFKEIWGKNYISFNPKDPKDIRKKIEYFLEKKPKFFYKNILKKYSFEKMTRETLKIYHKID